MKRRADESDDEAAAATKSGANDLVDDQAEAGGSANEGIDSDESDGERIDFSDDDDEEERPKRKKRKARRNQFVDIEAGEADEDSEEEDEDYGYGDEAELSDADLPRPEDYIRRLPPRKAVPRAEAEEEEEEFDAEAEEERLRRLYGRRTDVSTGSGEGDGIPRSAMMMPKATDPKLWLVKCRPGRERDAVMSIVKGLLDLDKRGEEVPPIFSAVSRDTLKGYLYLEAFKAGDIVAAVRRLHLNHVVFASQYSKPTLVPMGEMADVLAPGRIATSKSEDAGTGVGPGDWCRVKRGKYAGDLAQVLEVPEEPLDPQSLLRVRLLPRLSYRASTTGNTGKKSDRPPARPFDPHEAAQYGSVTKSRGLWVFAQEFYSKEGFLVKEVKLSSLAVGSVTPRPDELERFGGAAHGDEEPSNSLKKKKKIVLPVQFSKGDRVVVLDDGAGLRGAKGCIESVQLQQNKPAWLNVTLDQGNLEMTFSVDQVCRCFDIGDQVRVISTGQSGMVVDVEEDYKAVLVLSLSTQQQFSVAVADLQPLDSSVPVPTKPLTSTGTTAVELNDLVQSLDSVDPIFGIVTRIHPEEAQLTIVDQAGTQRTLALSQVKRLDTRALQADSSSSDAFKAGDRVQVDSVQGQATRPATILQVYRTVAFVKTVDTQEILVRRFHAVHKLGPAPGADPSMSGQLSRPAGGGGGGRHLLGKSVTIAGGPYKGYAGIVKDVIDNLARVELHTNSKIINIDRDRIIPVGGPSSSSGQYQRPGDEAMHGGFSRGGKTPAWNTSKTPAWGTSKTPAWNAASGKTPAWNAASGKTPAWNAGSGKTPTWSAQSGKTPAWNAGSGKTPAWDQPSGAAAGGKTPAWNTGGKTPTWNAGGKTPTWNAGGKTPAWNNPVPAPSSDPTNPAWAQQGIHVHPRGASGDSHPIVSLAPGKITLQNGQSYRAADLEPAAPAKKDRVKVLAGGEGTGVVIGLDGPDAVVRMDDTSTFRIVPLSNLGRLSTQ